jgi:hypothetical protein
MGVTSLKRKARKNRTVSRQRTQGLKKSKLGTYAKPKTEENNEGGAE